MPTISHGTAIFYTMSLNIALSKVYQLRINGTLLWCDC